MSGRRTAAIVPNWNGAARLPRCLRSIAAQTGATADIVVADNASSDGSPEVAVATGARVLRLPENRGFAGAVNRAVAETNSEFVALINNDVELDAGWLAALIEGLDRHPECGMATGRTMMYGEQRLLDGAGDALCLGFAAARLGYGNRDGVFYQQERRVLAVSGAACLIRRRVFEHIGGLEETFFAYLEDVDFCLRAQLAGFQALYVPGAMAWHEGSASSGGAAALHPRVATLMTAHQLLLAARYARGGALRVMLPRIVLVQLLWAARLLLRGRAGAWLRGLALAARHWKRMRRWSFPGGAGPRRLLELLRASEAQIYADRRRKEAFWRAYFALFPPPVKAVKNCELRVKN
jgi:GT2 family glycosyltransferase